MLDLLFRAQSSGYDSQRTPMPPHLAARLNPRSSDSEAVRVSVAVLLSSTILAHTHTPGVVDDNVKWGRLPAPASGPRQETD